MDGAKDGGRKRQIKEIEPNLKAQRSRRASSIKPSTLNPIQKCTKNTDQLIGHQPRQQRSSQKKPLHNGTGGNCIPLGTQFSAIELTLAQAHSPTRTRSAHIPVPFNHPQASPPPCFSRSLSSTALPHRFRLRLFSLFQCRCWWTRKSRGRRGCASHPVRKRQH